MVAKESLFLWHKRADGLKVVCLKLETRKNR